MRSVQVASVLHAPRAPVWEGASTLAGVNAELRPLLRMTGPSDVPLREGRLGRSVLLLGGVVPVDVSTLTLLSVDPGRGFVEQSPMLAMRSWRHVRVLEDHPEGCRLSDVLELATRLPAADPVAGAVVRRLFAHRHARLRARWGGRAEPSTEPSR